MVPATALLINSKNKKVYGAIGLVFVFKYLITHKIIFFSEEAKLMDIFIESEIYK